MRKIWLTFLDERNIVVEGEYELIDDSHPAKIIVQTNTGNLLHIPYYRLIKAKEKRKVSVEDNKPLHSKGGLNKIR